MEKIIKDYLNEYYVVDTSEFGSSNIYIKLDIKKNRVPVSMGIFTKELINIFAIDKEDIKKYVNDWAKTFDSDIDLKFFWMTDTEFFNYLKSNPEYSVNKY